MSAFVLKLIAIFAMTCDHVSYLIFGTSSFLNYIGRFAFPIFAYQISEGYIHTSNLKKYFLRLFIFALISQIPFMLFLSMFSNPLRLNIFFTLLFGLGAITIYDNLDKLEYKNNIFHRLYQGLGILAVFSISYISSVLKSDYGYFGVLIIFSFFLFKNHKFLNNISYIILVLIYYLKNLLYSSTNFYLILMICTIIPIFLINLYNNKKGKDTKYFLYLFYPLHLLIIYAIYMLINL